MSLINPINFHGNYMVLELTNRCCCSCIHCARSPDSPYFRQMGEIPQELIRGLIKDLVEANIKFYDFNLFWLGEPLMHSSFSKIYSFLSEQNQMHKLFGSINVHTNAHYLTGKVIEVVRRYNSVPQTWHLTLDAVTPQTYKKIKRSEGFEDVVENAKRFIKHKSGDFPRIVLQFIVEELNAHEAKDFIRQWGDEFQKAGHGFSKVAYFVPGYIDNFIFLRQCDAIHGGISRQVRLNKLYQRVLEENKIPPHDYSNKRPFFYPEGFVSVPYGERKHNLNPDFNEPSICSGFWKTPTISWSGEVTVCQRDSAMELKVGNLNQNQFSEIWWGSEEIELKRRDVIQQNFKNLNPCLNCIVPKSSNYSTISNEEIEFYLNQKNEKRLP